MAAFDPASRHGMLPDETYVPDVLAKGLKIVFCGTALGFMSAKHQAYYAHPGNLFWRTLYRTGLTPQLIPPAQYRQVLRFGIGLTDLCKNAYGLDTQLPKDAFDVPALRAKLHAHRPGIVAFTSKTAAAAYLERPTGKFAYGMQSATDAPSRVFVLPSPSGQARVFWNEAIWQDLADLVA